MSFDDKFKDLFHDQPSTDGINPDALWDSIEKELDTPAVFPKNYGYLKYLVALIIPVLTIGTFCLYLNSTNSSTINSTITNVNEKSNSKEKSEVLAVNNNKRNTESESDLEIEKTVVDNEIPIIINQKDTETLASNTNAGSEINNKQIVENVGTTKVPEIELVTKNTSDVNSIRITNEPILGKQIEISDQKVNNTETVVLSNKLEEEDNNETLAEISLKSTLNNSTETINAITNENKPLKIVEAIQENGFVDKNSDNTVDFNKEIAPLEIVDEHKSTDNTNIFLKKDPVLPIEKSVVLLEDNTTKARQTTENIKQEPENINNKNKSVITKKRERNTAFIPLKKLTENFTVSKLNFNKENKIKPIKIPKYTFKKSKCQLGVFTGVSLTNLSFSGADLENMAYENQLNKAYSSSFGETVAIHFNWVLKTIPLVIASGIEYNKLESRFQYQGETDSSYININEILVDGIARRNVVHYNKIKLISLPIQVGSYIRLNRFTLGVNVGGKLNLLLSENGKTLDSFGKVNSYDANNSERTLPTIFVSAHINPNLAYQINKKWQVQLSPQINYLFSGKSNLHQLNSKAWVYDLKLGVVYEF